MTTSQEELTKKIQDKEDRKRVRDFKKTIKTWIMTSRFNTVTRNQNEIYRNRYWQTGCIYCTPILINHKIPQGSKIIVLEMDNDKNEIFALGLLTNKPFTSKFSVYEDNNYNRFNYAGKYRIQRNECTKEEEDILVMLDFLCFKGNHHMKRGQGITAFPAKILWKLADHFDITTFLENMFKSRFSKNH
jgi:hypothetical protein